MSKNKRKAQISQKIFYFQFLYLFVICSSFVVFKWTIGLKKIFSTLSNCGFFQYCNSNILIFSNVYHIKLTFFQLGDSISCHSFSLLEAIAISLPLLVAIATNTFIVGRAKTIERAIEIRSHESIVKIWYKKIDKEVITQLEKQ